MHPIILFHYGEIGLKGRNRDWFEKRLLRNVREAFRGTGLSLVRRRGRLVGYGKEPFGAEAIKVMAGKSEKIFGIENFSFGFEADQEFQSVQQAVFDLLRQKEDWQTFAIRTKRAEKSAGNTSVEWNRKLGSAVLQAFPRKQVDLTQPDMTISVELAEKRAYITGERHAGSGGLPTGVGGRVLCLLSGGIDSPVAAWYMMKRGCIVDAIHFHSAPYTSRASIEKVEELTDTLRRFCGFGRLMAVPFAETQKNIITHCQSSYRVILYRREMVRQAERTARERGAQALVTGESLGQVASQTIENISVIEEVATMPIFRPLIGMDKKEIIEIAKRIGTYETSILPHEDCCSFFMPQRPVTRASLADVKREEEKLL
jgi:thiamine biosynthesis protein ThiI